MERCEFCERDFENPVDFYVLKNGTHCCEYCVKGLEWDIDRNINDTV
jgi:hypothetical protein